MKARIAILAAVAGLTVLGGCRSEGDIVVDTGVGITALRSVCPAVGVPDYTGDITLFSPADARTLDALDVTAAITNVRSTCDETGDQVYSSATFDVVATRRDTAGRAHGHAAILFHCHARRVFRGGEADRPG